VAVAEVKTAQVAQATLHFLAKAEQVEEHLAQETGVVATGVALAAVLAVVL
jgi:hypothetical protein